MSRDSFLMYRSHFDALMELSGDEVKASLKAIGEYAMDGIIPEDNGVAKAMFLMMKPVIDANNKKALNRIKQENEEQTKTNKNKQEQTETNDNNEEQTDNILELNVKGERRNDKYKNKEIEEIVNSWNSLATVGVPSIRMVKSGSKRYKALTARLKEYGQEDILKAIENVKQSKFLQGKNSRGWVITFDWLLLPSNFPKVLEGNYQDREGEKPKDANSMMMSRNYDWAELEKQLLAAQ